VSNAIFTICVLLIPCAFFIQQSTTRRSSLYSDPLSGPARHVVVPTWQILSDLAPLPTAGTSVNDHVAELVLLHTPVTSAIMPAQPILALYVVSNDWQFIVSPWLTATSANRASRTHLIDMIEE